MKNRLTMFLHPSEYRAFKAAGCFVPSDLDRDGVAGEEVLDVVYSERPIIRIVKPIPKGTNL